MDRSRLLDGDEEMGVFLEDLRGTEYPLLETLS
jgi:hypothetical protein